MKVLSLDPGLKNLAYCYMDVSTSPPTILQWDILYITDGNCKKMSIEEIMDALLIALNSKFNDEFEADTILIENQPALKNGHMKTISVALYTYFNMMRLQYGTIGEVKFISATNKLKCSKADNLKIDTYKDRKKASIDLARLYITEWCADKLDWFNKLKKADDMSDCFNQLIYYGEKQKYI